MARARRLMVGFLLCTTGAAGLVTSTAPSSSAATGPTASTLYREAIVSTHAWSVHYASSSVQAKQTLVESGDTGPASGSQSVLLGTGSIDIVVIGGLTYLKGNEGGLQALAGLSATQAAEGAGRWIEFSTDNAAFSQVVAGVRSHDVADELALKGPLRLGHPQTLDGYAVEAIEGKQAVGRTSMRVVLYVRANGTHVPVEEDSVNGQGRRTDAEHIAYSKWGEHVRPQAPQASISVGPISAV